MGMTIEKTMNELKTQIRYYKDFWGADASDYVVDAFNTAISTMRKYQKIEQIVNEYNLQLCDNTSDGAYNFQRIKEVVEDDSN